MTEQANALGIGRQFALPMVLVAVAATGAFVLARPAPLPAAALAVFVAAAISAIVGFAFSAIAASMLLRIIPDHVMAVEVMLISSIAIQCYCVGSLMPQVRLRPLAWFVLGGMLALPFGLYALLHLHAATYSLLIGTILIAYGGATMLLPALQVRSAGVLGDTLAGAIGGITGPLAAFPGAAAVAWCGLRGWSKDDQRAVYQPYILIMQLAALVGLGCSGEIGRLEPGHFLFAIPALLGAYLGLAVYGKLNDRQFRRLVNVLLIVSGLGMLAA